jgi:hypothetical protein
LWALYTDVDQILAARIVAKKQELDRRLEQLHHTDGPAVHQSSVSARHHRVATGSEKGVALAANLAGERGSSGKVMGPSLNACRRSLRLWLHVSSWQTDQETAAAEPADVHNREQWQCNTTASLTSAALFLQCLDTYQVANVEPLVLKCFPDIDRHTLWQAYNVALVAYTSGTGLKQQQKEAAAAAISEFGT